MIARPYVGITGLVDTTEVGEVRKMFNIAGYSMSGEHIPMIGFLVSYKTLNGHHTDNRRYPEFDELPRLLGAAKGKALNMVHYNSRSDNFSDEVFRVFYEIYDNELCRALQLNIAWPDIKQVERIKARFPEMQIVLQLSKGAMAEKTPGEIAGEVKNYDGLVNYVLIDPSGGKGQKFDLENSCKIYSAIREETPNLVIGFAGGFTGDNVKKRVGRLVEIVRDDSFCIDAEGGLRIKMGKEYGNDIFDVTRTKQYIFEAGNAFNVRNL